MIYCNNIAYIYGIGNKDYCYFLFGWQQFYGLICKSVLLRIHQRQDEFEPHGIHKHLLIATIGNGFSGMVPIYGSIIGFDNDLLNDYGNRIVVLYLQYQRSGSVPLNVMLYLALGTGKTFLGFPFFVPLQDHGFYLLKNIAKNTHWPVLRFGDRVGCLNICRAAGQAKFFKRIRLT